MENKFAVILGDIYAGETVVGPFNSTEEAAAWAEAQSEGLDWRTADMLAPSL